MVNYSYVQAVSGLCIMRKFLMHVLFALLVSATNRSHTKYTSVTRREMCEYLKCSSPFALL
jgi:hypothetical protein